MHPSSLVVKPKFRWRFRGRRLWRAQTNPYTALNLVRARPATPLSSASTDLGVAATGFVEGFWGILSPPLAWEVRRGTL